MGYLSTSFLPVSSCFFLDFMTGALNQCQNLYQAALSWVCKKQTTHGPSSGSKCNLNCTENDGGYQQKRASDSMWLNLFSSSGWHKKTLSLSFSSGACMHFGSPSHILSIVPCTSPSLWHLAAQLASPLPCILFAPHLSPCLCAAHGCLIWWTPCGFCCLTPQPNPVDPSSC